MHTGSCDAPRSRDDTMHVSVSYCVARYGQRMRVAKQSLLEEAPTDSQFTLLSKQNGRVYNNCAAASDRALNMHSTDAKHEGIGEKLLHTCLSIRNGVITQMYIA